VSVCGGQPLSRADFGHEFDPGVRVDADHAALDIWGRACVCACVCIYTLCMVRLRRIACPTRWRDGNSGECAACFRHTLSLRSSLLFDGAF